MTGRTTVDEKHMSSPRDFTQHFFLTVFSRVTHGGLSEIRTTRSLNKFYMLRLLNISPLSHSKSFWKLSWMTLLSVWSLYYWQNVCIRSNLSCLRTPKGWSEVAELDKLPYWRDVTIILLASVIGFPTSSHDFVESKQLYHESTTNLPIFEKHFP